MEVTSSGTAVVTLPADDQILIKREFAAPKDLVYKAWTTPELVKRWWSSDYGEMSVADIDLRVGGRWRFAMVTKDGLEVAFHGEYREIVPNERIVSTEVYEAAAEGGADTAAAEEQAAVNTVTFTEVGGATTLTVLVQCPTNDVRDAIIDSGMEVGMQKAYDYLEQVAVSLM
ncbi:MAG: ATPase [Actinobacteria bacterium]|nr:ATPase [Actinomycetota bacterium]